MSLYLLIAIFLAVNVIQNILVKQPYQPTKTDYIFFFGDILFGLSYLLPAVNLSLFGGFMILAFSQYYCRNLFRREPKQK